jgi:hypothetical protein
VKTAGGSGKLKRYRDDEHRREKPAAPKFESCPLREFKGATVRGTFWPHGTAPPRQSRRAIEFFSSTRLGLAPRSAARSSHADRSAVRSAHSRWFDSRALSRPSAIAPAECFFWRGGPDRAAALARRCSIQQCASDAGHMFASVPAAPPVLRQARQSGARRRTAARNPAARGCCRRARRSASRRGQARAARKSQGPDVRPGRRRAPCSPGINRGTGRDWNSTCKRLFNLPEAPWTSYRGTARCPDTPGRVKIEPCHRPATGINRQP